MQQTFCQFITEKRLFSPEHRLLLAVSGGMDSLAMCHLFHKAKYPFAIAHCNFQLRGAESDEDENFVKNLSSTYKVPFFVKHFETAAYAEEKKISIQMAARNLRYAWFEELLTKENYDFLATAHHKNDIVETILLNLSKGTGIHGLHGIKAVTGKIARPLLFATREQIKNYVSDEKLVWREDSSNDSLKYQRNLIRHEVVPVLKKINPNLEQTLEQTIEKISAVERIFDLKVEEVKKAALTYHKGYASIHIEEIKKQVEPGIILFEILKSYDFNYPDTLNLLNTNETGKRIESETHVAVKDRENFIITEKDTIQEGEMYIEKEDTELVTGRVKFIFTLAENKNFKIPNAADTACLDINKLQFPLTVRAWEEGDSFHPLGMSQKKKLSDYLIDAKIALNLKEKVKVLISNEKIAWVIGHRIDDRFKVSVDTEKIFIVKTEIL